MSDKARLAQEIATATRLLVQEEIIDYSGHISSRIPGSPNILIQTATHSRAELAPDHILVVDPAGNVVGGEGKAPLEVVLHTEILRARPEVNAVLHSHPEKAIAFTMMKDTPLAIMRARAFVFASGIPIHPDPRLIRRVEQGRELASTLGRHNAALIRAHGIVLVAESIPALFVDAIHFRENLDINMMVLQAGREPDPLTEDEIAAIDSPREFHIDKLWNYYIRRAVASGLIPPEWKSSLS
ncbi:class II aldolase/adducin family protein [Neorhizobium sp. DT-125]|uniref:class II aldolase/adducin family protein n=1 Tax=Neorhizobium sp. DT-125 TaxID=3396163 RepID=UPI003F19D023